MLSPDPAKARKDLDAFAAANDPRLYKLVKGCVDPQSDLRTIIKARVSHSHLLLRRADTQNELLRRIEQSHTDMLDTMTLVIDHAAWNILNHSAVSPLIKRMQRSEGPRGDAMSRSAFELFAFMAKECPPMLKSHVPELVIVMSDKKNALLSEAALRGLASVCKAHPESAPDDK
jgi:sister-chromatid-cohesion protein PDS5